MSQRVTEGTLSRLTRHPNSAGAELFVDDLALDLRDARAELAALRAELALLRCTVGEVWGERDRWDANPVEFIRWTYREMVYQMERGMKAEAELAALRLELERKDKALEFYADGANHVKTLNHSRLTGGWTKSRLDADRGKLARAALKPAPAETEEK